MPVSAVMNAGTGEPGSTIVWKVSSTDPSGPMRAAPISVNWQSAPRPVVSTSTTIHVTSSSTVPSWSRPIWTPVAGVSAGRAAVPSASRRSRTGVLATLFG